MRPVTRRFLATGVALSLLAPAIATAAPKDAPMPEPEKHRIIVPRTIGGVTLGDSLKQAHKAWGGNGECKKGACQWGGRMYAGDGAARIETEGGVVNYFFIGYSDTIGKEDVRSELLRFQTKEGLGLRQPLKNVKKEYPQAKPVRRANGRVNGYRIDGDNGYMTFIGGKRIEEIFVTAYEED